MSKHIEFSGLLNRIFKSAQNCRKNLPQALAPYISQQEYQQCLDVAMAQIKTPLMLAKISSLQCGQVIRIHKSTVSKLPRTLHFIRDHFGSFHLLLETKSKQANGLKSKQKKISSGLLKQGKTNWKIDGECIPFFNLVVNLDSIDQNQPLYQYLKNEAKISADCANHFVNPMVLSEPFINKGKIKASFFSLRADYNLKEFSKQFQISNSNQKKLQDSLIEQLLWAVKSFHSKGYVHCDIKPDNILVYVDNNNQVNLKLTDFGMSQVIGSKHSSGPVTTIGLHSPEVASYFDDPSMSLYEKYHGENQRHSLGNHFGRAYKKVSREVLQSHCTSNDVWQLGGVIFYIRYGRIPTKFDINTIQNDPLIKYMLNPDRNSRIGIDEAINIHKKNSQHVFRCNSKVNHFLGNYPTFLTLKEFIDVLRRTDMKTIESNLIHDLLYFLSTLELKDNLNLNQQFNINNVLVHFDLKKGFCFKIDSKESLIKEDYKPPKYFMNILTSDERKKIFHSSLAKTFACDKAIMNLGTDHHMPEAIWSAGLIIYYIKHGCLPKGNQKADFINLKSDDLLKLFLNSKKDTGINLFNLYQKFCSMESARANGANDDCPMNIKNIKRSRTEFEPPKETNTNNKKQTKKKRRCNVKLANRFQNNKRSKKSRVYGKAIYRIKNP